MESVYLETTVISYLVSRPSRDLLLAAHQGVTRDWWENERPKYRCVVSDEVVLEARRGDPVMASRRMAVIADIEILTVSEEMRSVAREFVRAGIFPPSMLSDAVHISVAMHYRMHYVLTWNCRHMANLHVAARLERVATGLGLTLPRVGTPLELAGGAGDAHQ